MARLGGQRALDAAVERAAQALGGLDLVVAAAAAGTFGRSEEIPPDDFDRCTAVTYAGTVNAIRSVLPRLERSGERLVVIGSAADAIGLTLMSPYVAAKHALDGFLESLRAELRAAGSDVTLSVVRPGAVDTPFWRHLRAERALGGLRRRVIGGGLGGRPSVLAAVRLRGARPDFGLETP